MEERIENRARFDIIRYANCWEDADILCEALQPAEGKHLLSIASAGDNAFALLAEGAHVTAADLSLAQLACVELRCAAFKNLSYDDLLAFLGIRPCDSRRDAYHAVREDISPTSREFWDPNEKQIEEGIIHAGKFEAYFRMFRTRVVPFIHSRRDVDTLLQEKSRAERERFYEDTWNNRRWRATFQIFFSRWMMARFGRDPEFFRYVEGSVADRILQRAKHGFTVVPTHDNPYLQYIFRGNFGEVLPRYLLPQNYEPIKNGLDRLQLHHGTIETAAQQLAVAGWDGFNLSDIFEYVDDELSKTIYGKLLDQSNRGARFAYWNMLVPRHCPREFDERVKPLDALSKKLFDADKAFFYSAFVVEEVME